MEDEAPSGTGVRGVATIAFGMVAAGACAYGFLLYGAFSLELAAARNEINLAHHEVAALRAQLSSVEAQANAAQEILQRTQVQLAAAQPRRELPVQLSFHEGVTRSGKVALLRNLADADLELVLEVDSPVSGEHVRRPLVINAHGMLRIGAAQGWQFAPGQIVTLNNDNYQPLVRIVS